MPAYGALHSSFKAQPIDELTGTFNALNETTNFRPEQGESTNIVHPAFRIGLINPDSMRPVDFGSFKPRDVKSVEICNPPDPEFNSLDDGDALRGIVHLEDDAIVGTTGMDKQFTTGGGGDSITGEGRRMNIWGNGGASTFEDRMTLDFDANDFHACPNKKSDQDFNDVVIDVVGYEGSGTWTCTSDGQVILTETFEPLAGMNSFGETLNPVAELAGTAGPGAQSYLTGSIGCQTMPPCSLGGSAGPGGDDI